MRGVRVSHHRFQLSAFLLSTVHDPLQNMKEMNRCLQKIWAMFVKIGWNFKYLKV